MSKHTVTLDASGRLLIPARYRKALGIGEGEALLMRLVDGELRLTTRRAALERAQRFVRCYVPEGTSLADELLAERRAEAEREGRGS